MDSKFKEKKIKEVAEKSMSSFHQRREGTLLYMLHWFGLTFGKVIRLQNTNMRKLNGVSPTDLSQ